MNINNLNNLNNNMSNINPPSEYTQIIKQIQDTLSVLFDKTTLFLSTIIGIFLSAIGFPNEIVVFVIILIALDIIIKQYSVVVMNYKYFTFHNYFKAWKDRKLTSRQMKHGIGVKTILYVPVLYIAHQFTIIPEILGGNVVSHIMYTALILTEIASIFESFNDCGYSQVLPLLKIIKSKQKELIEDVERGNINGDKK